MIMHLRKQYSACIRPRVALPCWAMDTPASAPKLQFDTHPSKYRHWILAVDGEVAKLSMKVQPFAGANSYMLAASTHPFKVNFCKYTNETRLAIEDASQNSGIRFLAACNGATAGGGYELALACDEIVLVDDGSSTVSLPEVPLLGVLPGTGGLTRVVDERKVRRDLADAFSTLAEGIKGKRAVEWGLVDAVAPRSKFAEAIQQRAKALAAAAPDVARGPGIELDALEPRVSEDRIEYRHVTLALDSGARVATLTVRAPEGEVPKDAAGALARGAAGWGIRAARELDDALLRLRFHHERIGLVLLRTEGDRAQAHAAGELLTGEQRN